MVQQNWSVGVYKRGENEPLWRYYVNRLLRPEGTWAVREFLTKEGKWVEQPILLHYFPSKEEASKFAVTHCGPMFSEVASESK